jgi:hypothetical protein
MSEPQEIEKTATAYASGAVLCEKQGETEKAVSLYQKAIECLNVLIQRYPNYGFGNIYRDRSTVYQQRMKAIEVALAKSESESKAQLLQPQESFVKPQVDVEKENGVSIDIAAVLQEMNRKLDDMAASIAELRDDIVILKLNVNDAVGKTELTQKDLAELRNLVYSIKYDR